MFRAGRLGGSNKIEFTDEYPDDNFKDDPVISKLVASRPNEYVIKFRYAQ